MTVYEITWAESSTHTAFIEADSAQAARQKWIDRSGELMPGEFIYGIGSKVLKIVEMPGPHDPLCCCPICEGALSG